MEKKVTKIVYLVMLGIMHYVIIHTVIQAIVSKLLKQDHILEETLFEKNVLKPQKYVNVC